MPSGRVTSHITIEYWDQLAMMLKVTGVLWSDENHCFDTYREKSRIHLDLERQTPSLKKCHRAPLGNTQLTFGTTVTCSWQEICMYNGGTQGLNIHM